MFLKSVNIFISQIVENVSFRKKVKKSGLSTVSISVEKCNI